MDTNSSTHETGFAQHRKKGEKGRARDNYHSRSMKVTREATVAVRGRCAARNYSRSTRHLKAWNTWRLR